MHCHWYWYHTDITCTLIQHIAHYVQQSQHINTHIMVPKIKIIFGMDQALKPERQDKYIFQEFHTILCSLRAIGSFVEGSGLDDTSLDKFPVGWTSHNSQYFRMETPHYRYHLIYILKHSLWRMIPWKSALIEHLLTLPVLATTYQKQRQYFILTVQRIQQNTWRCTYV